ncbi:MAG: chorismate synthase [Oscillospiraceae bacterium]|nr:chorismate synthase [Oscillospiraceae bacterium]
MSSYWGKNLKLTIFGESHSRGIGGVIDDLPAGISVDEAAIKEMLARRATGISKIATARKEPDIPEILSGVFNGKTTGTPLAFVIYNSDQHSSDYDNIASTARPAHADYTGFVRYGGYNDYRGGGHFSGRLTAPITFAGALANSWLESKGIYVAARIKSICGIEDEDKNIEQLSADEVRELKAKPFPTISDGQGQKMFDCAMEAKNDLDSVGGVIECTIINLPPGLGDPIFGAFESRLSELLFAVPAVKGVEFGAGFDIADMTGSEANDEFYMEGENIRTKTNYNGGVNGGITNGMPVTFRVAIKPTASISRPQNTVNFKTNTDAELVIKGRHDACITLRAVPVIESCAALCAMDFLLGGKKIDE